MFLVEKIEDDGFREIIETDDLNRAMQIAKESSLFWANESSMSDSEVRIYRGEIFAVAKVGPTVALADQQKCCSNCGGRLINWSPDPYCVNCGHIEKKKEEGNY